MAEQFLIFHDIYQRKSNEYCMVYQLNSVLMTKLIRKETSVLVLNPKLSHSINN